MPEASGAARRTIAPGVPLLEAVELFLAATVALFSPPAVPAGHGTIIHSDVTRSCMGWALEHPAPPSLGARVEREYLEGDGGAPFVACYMAAAGQDALTWPACRQAGEVAADPRERAWLKAAAVVCDCIDLDPGLACAESDHYRTHPVP